MLLLAVAVLGLPYYWLVLDNSVSGVPAYRLDIAQLRQAAGAIPGARPDSVTVQVVGWRRVPGTLMVAGGGLKRNLVAVQSFLLHAPGGNIVIDSGFDAAAARSMDMEKFLPAAQAKVDAAIRDARLVLFTHEHLDHMTGLLRMKDFASVAPHVLVTPEQGPGGPLARSLPWPRDTGRLVPRKLAPVQPVAPGVVVVRTPGHTPGSQMIFARLADGSEYLFAGDTASMRRNWSLKRLRSRLLSDYLAPEDRPQVMGWLRAINDLFRQDPGLIVVSGHDYDDLVTDPTKRAFREDFVTRTVIPRPPGSQLQ
ncbi:MBL fold metallo-hydrolase [Novosphingobium tardum]|uniref:MBL fold metallo-hydrolase n=1 Tax=Novosphingobium tardum TaxID=1538021 RepID=UPI0036D40DBD